MCLIPTWVPASSYSLIRAFPTLLPAASCFLYDSKHSKDEEAKERKMEFNRIEDMYLYGDRCVYLENGQGELFLTSPIVNVTPGSVVYEGLLDLSDDCVGIDINGKIYDGFTGFIEVLQEQPELFRYKLMTGEEVTLNDGYIFVKLDEKIWE